MDSAEHGGDRSPGSSRHQQREHILARLRAHFDTQFPKQCPSCGRTYASLADYVRATTPIGPAISYDVERRQWDPDSPFGAMAQSNCSCGSTLAVGTAGMPLEEIHSILAWIRAESALEGVPPESLVNDLRDEIRKRALEESAG